MQYIYIYIYRERERQTDRQTERETDRKKERPILIYVEVDGNVCIKALMLQRFLPG